MVKLDREELRSRWWHETGRQHAGLAIAALRRGRSLADLGFGDRHEGRWDLRGIAVGQVRPGRRLSVAEHEFEEIVGETNFTGARIAGVDLSCADLTQTVWERVSLDDVKFDNATMRSVGFWACKVRNCRFRSTDLTGASMGGHLGTQCNEFVDTSFERARLRDSAHSFEAYQGCDFSDADLLKVDFDGARFTNCTFAGLLDEVEFHRYSRFLAQPLLPWRKIDPRSFPNEMVSVDLRRAELRWVSFYGINLSGCVLPDDEWHLVVHEPRETFRRIRDLLLVKWTGEPRRIMSAYLSDMYIGDGGPHSPATDPERAALPIDVVNRKDLRDLLGDELGDQLFALVRTMADSGPPRDHRAGPSEHPNQV